MNIKKEFIWFNFKTKNDNGISSSGSLINVQLILSASSSNDIQYFFLIIT